MSPLDLPVPDNEAERLRALDEYQIVGTEPEQAFDDLAELAAQVCGCPLGYVNIVTEKHRWIKACYGLPVAMTEAPRSSSSCQWTVCQSDVVVVPDMTEDARFRDLPYVTGPPHLRFYAGAPLINPQGYVEALPQRQYGVARHGDLRDRFALWPTTISGTAVPDRVMAVHFDVVLPAAGFELPVGRAVEDLTDAELAALDALLGPSVEELLPLFLPRRAK